MKIKASFQKMLNWTNYSQTSQKLRSNPAPVDRGSKKLVMDEVSWNFSEDLVRLARYTCHLPQPR